MIKTTYNEGCQQIGLQTFTNYVLAIVILKACMKLDNWGRVGAQYFSGGGGGGVYKNVVLDHDQ